MPAYSPTYASDRAEIEDLMARYLFAMDYNDFETYADLFTEDGTLEYARGKVIGREEIRESARRFKEAVAGIYQDVDGNPAVLRHVLCQSVIRVEGDRAWHTGFWFETANDGPREASGRVTPTLGTFGIYEDELVRVNGEWKFSYRNILNEFLSGRESGNTNPVLRLDARAEDARAEESEGGSAPAKSTPSAATQAPAIAVKPAFSWRGIFSKA